MRNENCDRKSTCYDYKHNHCDGCGANKPKGDLISREALKEELDKVQYTQEFCIEHQIDYSISMQMLGLVIDNAPTVCGNNPKWCESCVSKGKCASTRPQGEWIDYDNTFYKCPDCGYLLEKCCPQCQNKVILPKGGAE